MRALGIYCLIILAFSFITLFVDIVNGFDVEASIWGIALYVPIAVFVIRVLQGKK